MDKSPDIWMQAAESAWQAIHVGVKNLREEGMTLQGIAKLLGVKSPAHVAEWISGERTAPNAPFPNMLRYLATLGHNPRDYVPSATGEMPEPAPKAQAPAPSCATCKKLLAKDKEIQKLQQQIEKLKLELAGAQGEVRALERQLERRDVEQTEPATAKRKMAG